jgi:hypothetical protein
VPALRDRDRKGSVPSASELVLFPVAIPASGERDSCEFRFRTFERSGCEVKVKATPTSQRARRRMGTPGYCIDPVTGALSAIACFRHLCHRCVDSVIFLEILRKTSLPNGYAL